MKYGFRSPFCFVSHAAATSMAKYSEEQRSTTKFGEVQRSSAKFSEVQRRTATLVLCRCITIRCRKIRKEEKAPDAVRACALGGPVYLAVSDEVDVRSTVTP